MSPILAACAELPETHFAPGEVLIAEGARDDRLFVLVSGRVSVRKGDKEVARIGSEGAIFGEMSALLDIPSSATVVALDEVRARVSEEAARFIEENPGLALHCARTLAQRLYHATAYLADLKAQFADHKDHFGMMDEILDELLQQQRKAAPRPQAAASDPRL